MARVAIALTIWTSAAREATAWGNAGHSVVAQIAEAHLTPQARAGVRELLKLENRSKLAEIGSWADGLRLQRPATARWHYVNIPLGGERYDRERDCPRSQCIVPKITEFAALLSNKNLVAQERLEALKFLVHFVGDLHQPLHAADHADRGGTLVQVTGLGDRTNLHNVWDVALVEAMDTNAQVLAGRLRTTIGSSDAMLWMLGTPIHWAEESHALAVKIYARLGSPLPDSTIALTPAYAVEQRPIVEKQLKKAGIRLAALLNQALN